ncbi:MAG: serine--tRNA ligase, partial [Chlamydiia bacterium]|nr:serine--tRNA ligase [Chlamydiia bacterium]
MLDFKEIRKDPATFEQKLKTKIPETSLSPLLELDEKLRSLKTEVEKLKSQKNAASKEIGYKKQKKEDATQLLQEMSSLNEQISCLDPKIHELEESFLKKLCMLPNLPMEEIPFGLDPKENVCIKMVGEKPSFSFPFRNHVELNEKLHLFDFPRGAKVSGSGWPLYKGIGARIEWA